MSNFTGLRPTWAEINLDNLIHNFHLAKAVAGEGVALMAAVKADAYGHGAVECARALESAGADWFGVALPEEGVKLRLEGIAKPILCLGGFWEGQEDLLVAHRLTPVIFRLDMLERLNEAGCKAGVAVDFHLKVDTGMGRLGVQCGELSAFLNAAVRFKYTRLDGLMTHLASADDNRQSGFTQHQIAQFERAVEEANSRGHRPSWIHLANSAGVLACPSSRRNLVRLGGVLYGLWRDVTDRSLEPLDWRPVMSLRTRIVLVKSVPEGSRLGYGGTFTTARESRIGTIPIGYEDGLRRGLSNCGRVLVRGQFAAIVGRVSMDLTLIDLSEVAGAAAGDEVVVIGRQGSNEITAEEVAAAAGTISYEVTCGISDRVPRVYARSQYVTDETRINSDQPDIKR